MPKPRTPTTFERDGRAYVGHAVVLMNDAGIEIIIVAPSVDEAVEVAACLGHTSINRSLIHKVAVDKHA